MNIVRYIQIYGDVMEKNNFLYLLIFSLVSSALIFFFGVFLWGLFLINLSAFAYYQLQNGRVKIIIFTVLIILLIYLIFNFQHFLILSTIILFILSLHMLIGEIKNDKI